MAIYSIILAQSYSHSIQTVQIILECNSNAKQCNASFCFSHFMEIDSTPLFIGNPTCFCSRRSLHTSFCAPYSSLADVARWTKSDRELFPFVSQLHSVIRSHSKDEAEYKRYFSSLKNSVLTAFYTPQAITLPNWATTELPRPVSSTRRAEPEYLSMLSNNNPHNNRPPNSSPLNSIPLAPTYPQARQ